MFHNIFHIGFNMTGLKLSVLALAVGGLESTLGQFTDVWVKLGIAGMAVLGLIYVYRDMRNVHKEKEDVLLQHTEVIKKIMSEHKEDIKELVKEQSEAARTIAKLAAEATTQSNEVLRDNVQIMVEVKDVIKANTAAVIWCRDSAVARARHIE